MLSETEELDLPEGLETFSTIVSVRWGPNHRLKVPFLNNSKHDNTQQKTLLLVSYITLLQLKERKSIVSTVDTQIENIASATKEQQQQVLPKLGAKKHQIKALDKIDLSDLTPKKRTAVPKLLIEEAAEAVVKRCSIKNYFNPNISRTKHYFHSNKDINLYHFRIYTSEKDVFKENKF